MMVMVEILIKVVRPMLVNNVDIDIRVGLASCSLNYLLIIMYKRYIKNNIKFK